MHTTEQKFKEKLMATKNVELIDAYLDFEKDFMSIITGANMILEKTRNKLTQNEKRG